MDQVRDRETANMILQNPTLWNKGTIEETLQRFKESDSQNADCDFDLPDVQELIRDHLLTLSNAMKKEESIRKEKRIARILVTKLGEGYEAAMATFTLAFRDAGHEVIYTDIQRPSAIVASAIQECVDHIGITILPGANIGDLASVVELLKKEDSSHIGVTAGGYLDDDKVLKVKEMGVVEFFPIGTSLSELIHWAQDNIKPT
ncbi:MAG TPA: cobalamin-dependent protein [Syntrophales bacterium]|nr:cobalamin-dependent protein [Syntrophales bacterium]